MTRTPHQQRIIAFMEKAGQEVPMAPCVPSEATRILRARLIMEECLETIEALGVTLTAQCRTEDSTYEVRLKAKMDVLRFKADGIADLVEIADGCGDISVVTIGTLVACGIQDEPILEAVDANNLAKFGPGSYRDEHGKWRKPENFVKVDLAPLISAQVNAHQQLRAGGQAFTNDASGRGVRVGGDVETD